MDHKIYRTKSMYSVVIDENLTFEENSFIGFLNSYFNSYERNKFLNIFDKCWCPIDTNYICKVLNISKYSLRNYLKSLNKKMFIQTIIYGLPPHNYFRFYEDGE